MSVPVKERKQNPMEYIKKGQELYMRTINTFSKISGTYPELIDSLKDLSNQYFLKAYMADGVYIDKYTVKEIFRKREFLLEEAITSLNGYRAQLNLLYSMIIRGDSRLGNKAEVERKFRLISRIVTEAHALILGVKKSDAERWEQWHPTVKQQNRNKDKADKHKPVEDAGGFKDEQLSTIVESLQAYTEYKKEQEMKEKID